MPEPGRVTERGTWRQVPRWVRCCVSAWLVLHLAAVCVPPLAVAPASQLSSVAWRVLQPYIEVMFLDHGYRFFAPEPGPSHLIRYELQFADGARREGQFPDLREHQPRLLYHRHFMMSEFVNSVAGFRPDVADAYTRAYAQHLLSKSGAERVTMHLRRHLLASPQQVLEGVSIRDPRLYTERPLGTYSRVKP